MGEVPSLSALYGDSGLGNGWYWLDSDDVKEVVLDVWECSQVVFDARGFVNREF